MTAPAAPLEKAVANARKSLKRAEHGYASPFGTKGCHCLGCALSRLLAALDADRGEAEAALKEIDECAHRYVQTGYCSESHDKDECGPCIARRYFARREGAAVRGDAATGEGRNG